MSVAFVFTNPRHHLEMMKPVAAELERRGVACELISLAELRGLDTPHGAARRAIPFNLRKRRGRPAQASEHAVDWRKGRLAKRAVWKLALAPRLSMMLRRARVVVIPNDAVYPYVELVAQLRERGIPTVLMQEGIRFPLPRRLRRSAVRSRRGYGVRLGRGQPRLLRREQGATRRDRGDRGATTRRPRSRPLARPRQRASRPSRSRESPPRVPVESDRDPGIRRQTAQAGVVRAAPRRGRTGRTCARARDHRQEPPPRRPRGLPACRRGQLLLRGVACSSCPMRRSSRRSRPRAPRSC